MFDKIKNKLFGKVGLGNLSIREEWLEKTLKTIPKGSSILDAGAGELKYKKFCDHLKYTSQDFGGYDGLGNHEGKQTESWDNSKLDIVSDIINIPVAQETFDAVMCIEVFEHISEPALAVKEFQRVLKQGGKVIITAPFCSITHFAPYYFANGYSKYWYEKVLTEHGFVIDEMVFNGNYFEYIAQEIRRLPEIESEYGTSSIGKGILSKINRYFMLFVLNQMSQKNKKSEELLCFGIHILAHKK